MTDTIVRHTVTVADLTLSQHAWRLFGLVPVGFVETVLASHPGLAQHVLIPLGTVIAFPVDQIAQAQDKQQVVRLWD